jgi:hypothetical protein
MKFVYILEKDPRFINEIIEAVVKIDSQLQVRIFQELEKFAEWIQVLAKEGAKAIAKGGQAPAEIHGVKATSKQAGGESGESPPAAGAASDQLAILISDNGILGSKHLALLKKTQSLFVQKDLCTKEDPTAIVITAFDNPDFDLATVEDRTINNVIFKPFDPMILLQHLIFAIGGRHPPSENTLHNMKTSALVEMLKDVEVEAYSDMGFVSVSARQVPLGSVRKYYGDVFSSGKTRSVFARCYSCEPHPLDKKKFQCTFTYFGTEPEQISTFRKNSLSSNSKESDFTWRPKPSKEVTYLVMIDPDESGPAPLAGTLERSFSNVKVVSYKSLIEFLTDMDPSQRAKSTKQPPAFPGGIKIKLLFDPVTHKLLKTDPEIAKGQVILGHSTLDFQKLDFLHWVPEGQRPSLLAMIKGTAKPNSVLTLQNKEHEFFIKFEGHRTVDLGGKKVSEVSLGEMLETEKNQWFAKNSRLPEKVHGVLINEKFIRSDDLNQWLVIRDNLKSRAKVPSTDKDFRTEFIVLAKERKDDWALRALGELFSNVFYKPIERNYFSKQIYLHFPKLIPINAFELKQFNKKEKIEVANPAKVTEISEAGLVLNYYRAINIGSFRKFVLWFPMEIGQPVMLGSCNFNVPLEGEETGFENHFVFFGMTDLYLQHVRVWIRENYVNSKQNP